MNIERKTIDRILDLLDTLVEENRPPKIKEYLASIECLVGSLYPIPDDYIENLTHEPDADWTYEELSTGGQHD